MLVFKIVSGKRCAQNGMQNYGFVYNVVEIVLSNQTCNNSLKGLRVQTSTGRTK